MPILIHGAGETPQNPLPVSRGGTGKTSWAANRLPYPSTATGFAQMPFPAAAGSVLRQNTSGAPYWSSLADLAAALGGAKVEIVSYAGTGTFGVDHPCSVSFSFAPKVVFALGSVRDRVFTVLYQNYESPNDTIVTELLTTEYSSGYGFGNASRDAKVSADGKTITWYSKNSAIGGDASVYAQLNDSSRKYYFLAIG